MSMSFCAPCVRQTQAARGQVCQPVVWSSYDRVALPFRRAVHEQMRWSITQLKRRCCKQSIIQLKSAESVLLSNSTKHNAVLGSHALQ